MGNCMILMSFNVVEVMKALLICLLEERKRKEGEISVIEEKAKMLLHIDKRLLCKNPIESVIIEYFFLLPKLLDKNTR